MTIRELINYGVDKQIEICADVICDDGEIKTILSTDVYVMQDENDVLTLKICENE